MSTSQPQPPHLSTVLLARIRAHPVTAILCTVAAVAVAVGGVAQVPQNLAEAWRFVAGDPPVDTNDLQDLEDAGTLNNFNGILGEPDDAHSVEVAVFDAETLERSVRLWVRYTWLEAEAYQVDAVVDSVGAIRGYGIKTFSDGFRPQVPCLHGELGRASFVDVTAALGDSRAPLEARTADSFANTTAPRYVEWYSINSPCWRSVVLALGGGRLDAGSAELEAHGASAIYELSSASDEGNHVSCSGQECETPPPPSVLRFREEHGPDSFYLLDEDISLEDASAAGLF